ncbi:MexE family multidrug efflux RND transporter periplasmic adaptor subunit [Malaciobacter pacificus]|uniref:RND family efflux system, membrane fusion protein n=1 Tax=Malaciobacter pacificus TaxID=1080223 RepID=A0A5C2H7G2_9BACT|nr:efflux RND transporter periplasmic adaptor subunit [Malaciobacter pacificus]QEP34877.1 RND family efflux system, membrane fusion protein [Malaciobacter pacificus]GGD48160.1 MexE family multidrug efflux RND transporter periplasmic adaptor subunit [Malaciobacter pacificus]
MNVHKKILTSMLLISSLFILSGCNDKKEEQKVEVKKEIPKAQVQVHTIKKETYPIWVDFSGKTEAKNSVFVTAKVAGELKEIYFKAGETVKKGQKLFKIDDRAYQTVLSQKRASLQKDRASLNLAIANVKRYKPLVEKGLAPREKLDELIANQRQLQAVVNADQASIQETQIDVDDTVIKASISGKVGKSLIDIGNNVSTSDKLVHITQSNDLYVNFNLSSKEVFLLNQYKSEKYPKVIVLPEDIDNIELGLKGKVDFIDSVTDEKTGTVAIRATVNNEKELLFPGTFVNIKLFVTDKIPVIAVHPNNLSQNQLGFFVYAVDENNKVQKRQVEVEYSNKDLAIIKSGLNAGDKVITSATNRLQENQEVVASEVANPIKK